MNNMQKKLSAIVFSAMALAAWLPATSHAVTAPESVVFKSALADKANMLALQNAINQAALASLLQRAQAIQNVEYRASVVKQDLYNFASRLKANNEVETFNAKVLALAAKQGGKVLVNEINSYGGPYVLLTKSTAIINQELSALKSNLSLASYLPSLTELLGISDAHAGILSTACGAFWFTVTLGYGERFAYTSCYK